MPSNREINRKVAMANSQIKFCNLIAPLCWLFIDEDMLISKPKYNINIILREN